MRHDFGRVVIERERRGSSSRSLKMRKVGSVNTAGADWEDWEFEGPTRIGSGGIRHAWDRKLGEKSFSDVLRPIEGFLHKSVGRPWNDVHSEASRLLGGCGVALSHVFHTHLLHAVDIHTWAGENGKVYSQPNTRHYGDYYVCPRTGVLRKEAARPRRRRSRAETNRVQAAGKWFVWMGNRRGQHNWYIGVYSAVPCVCCPHHSRLVPPRHQYFPHPPEWALNWPDITSHAANQYFHKEKQAGKRELRQLRALQKSALAAAKLDM